MNYPPYSNDPNDPHSQPTMAGPYPQWGQQPGQPPQYPQQPGQPSYPQWGQQAPPPPPQFPQQPGQFSQSGQNFPQYAQQYSLPGLSSNSWYKTNEGIIVLLILFCPVGLYLMWQHAKWRTKTKRIVTGILTFCVICGGIANASGSTQQSASQQTSSPMTTPDQIPTEKPIPIVTPTPMPTPTPKPVPTQAPVQQQQPVQQQSAPPPSGVNGNPWGYDFNPGNLIYSPPDTFCNYFNCIASFWKGSGYVVECSDETYSKSGGHTGSCSRHGGDWRALYSH